MMKKLFFFKSSVSTEGNTSSAPSSSRDKQANCENSANEGLNNQANRKSKAKNLSESQISGASPGLRRSRSYSSGIGHEVTFQRTQSGSPCSSSNNVLLRQSGRHSRRAPTPERHSREKWFEDTALYNAHGLEGFNNDSSESSSNASSKVLDRYIDGEQLQDKSGLQSRGNIGNVNGGGKRPPRVQYIEPASQKDGFKQKPKSHSFRESNKSSHLYNSSREWVDNGFGNESPRKLAKHVIERLSQSRALPRVSSSDFDPDIPITIEDIYGGSVRKCSSFHSDGVPREISTFQEKGCFLDDDYGVSDYAESEEDLDRAELESQRRRLEKEKHEMQVSLEKELDRRSNEWSLKLEKYQAEEHRLRERVRELAEQNVSLQREISTFCQKEIDIKSRLTNSDQQLQDLNLRTEKITKENQNLQQKLSELQEKYRAADEDRECFRRNYEDKEKECKELHRAVARMLRTCTEQEKTIEGLREGISKEVKKKNSSEILDHNQFLKLQAEQVRLTGVEQSLRKKVESCRLEVDSLRHENINLLNRLKESSKDNEFSTFKLDQEMSDRLDCLKSQGLSLLNESTELCTKLLETIRKRPGQTSESKNGIEGIKNGLDGQFVIESDMKLQGLKRGAENLGRSLHTVSRVLHEKSNAMLQSQSMGEGSTPVNNRISEDMVKCDLKAETLVTSLLREKLYSKELDMEQLRAELAASVRGNDVLRYEIQNALDALSCANHKMKDLELQMIKKDDNIYRLQNELQECKKELSMVKGILPKVSEERDMMWEEVKQYSENNVLLSSEVGMLKKKIETLDEDVLLKEGQITILKDALGKPFDLLASPGEFRLS